jgi:hypothetical protein
MMPTETEAAEALGVATVLLEAGVPLFIAKPAMKGREWEPAGGHQKTGYWFPSAWEKTEVDPEVLDGWAPGAALCALMGVVVDGIDVDPRNGGKKSVKELRKAGRLPAPLARQSTPSGGYHHLIASLDVASRDALMPGVDYKAGTSTGSGRGFLFIAPTVKLSKVDGKPRPYLWEVPPTLAGLTS